MFEEICLTCSRQLPDDSRAYCSDECEALDVHNSPSISSASSALSSPLISHAHGGEVPALMPSALGSALSSFRKRDRYSTSSSSSSVSWSLFTDVEDDDPVIGIDDDSGCEADSAEGGIDPCIRSVASHHSGKLSGLMYTRRPSATNHHFMIPLLHRRTSSSSSLGHIPSPPDDELDFAHEASRHPRHEPPILAREADGNTATVTSKTKSRNRASLPAYFSLLQITSPQQSSPQRSQVLASSGNTISHNPRPSPPTPKLASLLSASGLRSTLESTPRGRRRDPEPSQYADSRSHSRSRTRRSTMATSRGRHDSRGSVEQVFDWTCVPLARGRPTARRNSSPLPKMVLSMQEFEDPALIAPAAHNERRGRYRTHELEGRGSSRDAPGYGNGRSGLKERERTASRW